MFELEKMIDEESIKNRVNEISYEINKVYENQELCVICILKGSFLFTSDIVKKLNMPVLLDFMIVSSYKDKTMSDGNVDIVKNIDIDIEGKNVLIIDDIIDTGYTMQEIIRETSKKNPKSISVCALFNKQPRREVNITGDFIGFEIGNEFIVGYGLDYKEKYRNLPYVGKVKQKCKK